MKYFPKQSQDCIIKVTDPQKLEVEVVMVEVVILEDVVVKVIVLTNSAEVEGRLELLECILIGGHMVIGPMVMLSLGGQEADTSYGVITCTLLVCDCMAFVLFDPGSTFSYVSSSFANGLNLHCELLDMPIRVSTQWVSLW